MIIPLLSHDIITIINIFSPIVGMMIQSDFHIFLRVETTNRSLSITIINHHYKHVNLINNHHH